MDQPGGRGSDRRPKTPLNLSRFEQEVADEITVALRKDRRQGGRRRRPSPEGPGQTPRPR